MACESVDPDTGTQCMLEPGHDAPVLDSTRCARCGNTASNHLMISHDLEPVQRPGGEHVAHIRWA